MRAFGCWVAIVVAGLLQACVEAEITPPAYSGEFSCICAYCAADPFCHRPGDPADAVPLPPSGDCADARPRISRSVSTSRLNRAGVLVPVECAGLDPAIVATRTDPTCPGMDFLSQVSDVDRCLDDSECRRRGEPYATLGCESGLTSCADPLDENFHGGDHFRICEEGALDETEEVITQRLRDKATDVCAHYHDAEGPPSGATPARYCFTSCLTTAIDRDCTATDPPFVGQLGGILLRVGTDPRTGDPSEATITVEGASDTTRVEGTVWLSAHGCGPGTSCTASVSWVDLRAIDAFDVRGETVTNVRLINLVPLPDSLTAVDATRSELTIDPGGALFVSGDASSSGRSGVQLGLTTPLTGDLYWTAHAFEIGADLGDDTGTAGLTLNLRGSLPSIPPTANAGPDRTVECTGPEGTPVGVSAEASSDPDGDLAGYRWNAPDTQVAFTSEATFTLPLGTHTARLEVRDALGQADGDSTSLTVEDTRGPEVERVELATDCLWPPDHSLHLFRLGEELVAEARDVCEGTAGTVRIVDVRSDQPADDLGDGTTAPDVLFGDGAFCLRGERQGTSRRPRSYTVVLEASDGAGNTTRHEIAIRVPHDQRPSDRCVTGGLAPAVDDDDPRCVATPAPAPLAPRSASDCSVSPVSGGGLSALWMLLAGFVVAWRRRSR